ncbi:MAG: hypothetical protein AB4911_20500, partial [Oscillochloridaceae bacterium umkhey_bin13]
MFFPASLVSWQRMLRPYVWGGAIEAPANGPTRAAAAGRQFIDGYAGVVGRADLSVAQGEHLRLDLPAIAQSVADQQIELLAIDAQASGDSAGAGA